MTESEVNHSVKSVCKDFKLGKEALQKKCFVCIQHSQLILAAVNSVLIRGVARSAKHPGL